MDLSVFSFKIMIFIYNFTNNGKILSNEFTLLSVNVKLKGKEVSELRSRLEYRRCGN